MTNEIVPLTNSDFTEVDLQGNGIFDVMMRSCGVHLLEEFTKGRFKADEYSKAYVSLVTASMANSVQFLLQRDSASLQAQLVAAQITLAEAEAEQTVVKLAILRNVLEKSANEVEVTRAQADLIRQQLISERAQTEEWYEGVLGKKQTQMTTETAAINQSADKTHAEYELLHIQQDNEKLFPKMQTATIGKISAENSLMASQRAKITSEQAKMAAEVALLGQKKVSEVAQTSDTANTNSVIGKQIQVYGAQVTGYKRKAEQSAAKTSLDAFAIMANAEDYEDIPACFQTGQISKVINKLNLGIGVV